MDDPHDAHATFIKSPKQLVIVVVLAFAIPIALIGLLSQLVTMLIGLISGADFPGWGFFVPAFTGAAIWPAVYLLLEIPRRPRPESGET